MESLSLIDVASEDDLLIPADDNPSDPQSSVLHVPWFCLSDLIFVTILLSLEIATSINPELRSLESVPTSHVEDHNEQNCVGLFALQSLLTEESQSAIDMIIIAEHHGLLKVSFSLESAGAWQGENPAKMGKQMEQAPELSESPELKRAKSGKINLRKSLAWDSAFFTSEGVLENEELAIVNSTFRKAERCKLTGIQEDLWKSSESNSTLDNESYALESIEVGLFDNLRASIQMSLGKRDKASIVVSDTPRLGSVKKVGTLNKMKPPVNSKKGGVSKQPQQYSFKKADTGVKMDAEGSGQSKSLSRPPRTVSKPMLMVPSSKASSGSIQLKGNGVSPQSVVALDRANGNSHRSSRPNSSAKPTPGSRSGTFVFSTSSSYSGPVSGLSHSVGQSPLETSRKRTASRNNDHSLSGSAIKTPVRTQKSRLAPSKLKFTLKASPQSSIDSMVSESSSSASNTTKPSNSVESLGASSTSSSRSVAIPTNVDSSQAAPDRHLSTNNQSSLRKETFGILSQHSRNCINSDTGSRFSKPSGLRMPSPKIGYFDAEKTQVFRSSNKISQNTLRKSLVKSSIGTCKIVGENTQKPIKMTPVSPAVQLTSKNFDSPRNLSTSNAPNNSMRRASPISTCQHEEPAELHRLSLSAEDDHNMVFTSSKLADMEQLPTIHAELYGSAIFGEGYPNVTSEKRIGATYQISKELNHKQEQSLCSVDGQDEHMENIHSVAHKAEKENLLPVYEANGVTQHLTTKSKTKSMLEILGKKISSLSLSETSDSDP